MRARGKRACARQLLSWTPGCNRTGEVLLHVGLVRDVRGHLLENDKVERKARTHVPHELEVVDHAVAHDVRLDGLGRKVAPPLDLDLDRVELEVRPVCCVRRSRRGRALLVLPVPVAPISCNCHAFSGAGFVGNLCAKVKSRTVQVLRSSVDMRPSQKEPGTLICLPICSIGFFRSGSACCVMGCCFLAEALRLLDAGMSFLLLLLLGASG